MALFPDCSFSVRLPAKELVAGARAVGTLDLAVPEPIPRADHVDLVFRTEAWAGYGGGKSRTEIRRTVFLAPLRIDFPRGEPLAAGTHSFPFGVDVPALLGPGFQGDDCGFVHAIDVRLDVDWARDPKETLTPIVRLPPRDGRRTPLVTRTTAEFHDRLVLEVTLSSTTLVAGTDRVEGRLALRGGHDARLDAVSVHVVSRATVRMGRGDVRDGARTGTSIPASALRSGEAVPFGIPLDAFPPTFRNGFLDHDLVLLVTAKIPWASDPTLEIPLAVLPAGSTLWGEADVAPIGSERLRRHAAAMAAATGLAPGRVAPTLVEGRLGPVALTVDDAPAGGALGLDVSLTFPDVELGTMLRPLGVLDGFRDSPLLPPALRDRFLLRVEPRGGRPPFADETLAPFFAALLAGGEHADGVQLGDHHLRLHYRLVNDGSAEMVAHAEAAAHRARALGPLLARLPWPAAATPHAAAWEATATEESATLVPSGPALHGIVRSARVVGGELRHLRAAVRTDWRKGGPVTRIDVDLRSAPLPKDAAAELEGESARLEAVRALLPVAHVLAPDHVTLERSGLTADPRTLLPALDALLAWVVERRDERRVQHAYR